MLLLLIIFIGLPFLGWFVGTSIYDVLTKKSIAKPKKDTYIIHNHYDNRQVHLHQSNPQEENRPLD